MKIIIQVKLQLNTVAFLRQGGIQRKGGGAAGLQPPPPSRDLKATKFADKMISRVYVIYPSAELSH
jgi:hypothetical protein